MARQQERHAANQALGKVLGNSSVESLELVESEVKSRSASKRLAGFRKVPDESLADTIKRKQARRVSAHGRRKRNGIA
jgi:hypothetical protein